VVGYAGSKCLRRKKRNVGARGVLVMALDVFVHGGVSTCVLYRRACCGEDVVYNVVPN
jgi:hypothetical protein